MSTPQTPEHIRLADSEARKGDWKNWGPYVSERAWGTVREDYSPRGTAWEYFPHDHARSRAYRWNEDGLGGFCNRFQNICLGVALWNEHDPILKERLFGVTGNQGNHGEDVKEYYFYLDSTPTHSYAKMLYKYPQAAYPYNQLVEENARSGRQAPEYELIDALRETFYEKRYFDVFIEYAKADQEDILCRITAANRGPDAAPIHILPHLWFRNTWSWGYQRPRPQMRTLDDQTVCVEHRYLGERWWYIDHVGQTDSQKSHFADQNIPLLFTENETNHERLFDVPNASAYVKDGINDAVVNGQMEKVNPAREGTKAAAHFTTTVPAGESYTVRVRFTNVENQEPFADFDSQFAQRVQEADDFYAAMPNPALSDDEKLVQRQALAGLMWTKQFYHYGVKQWVEGDPGTPRPPESRLNGRNADWRHLYNLDVLSMPDKWEYPWYAAWDLAFHTLAIAMVDPEWAKRQITLLLREWYMHPNGQIPAYEWALGDVNPPVHAWAAWRVYKITRNITGYADTKFLESAFQKLLLNFTWWVNRKDTDGNNIFQGGFLGLDNIGVFDRSAPLPTGGHIEQADGTAWMGMYCLNMLAMALELARTSPAYEDMATKFFEHFTYIADAINNQYGKEGLWDDEEHFYYDVVHYPDGRHVPLRIRSFVGLIPLFAVETLEPDLLAQLPRFKKRMNWFVENRPNLIKNIASLSDSGLNGRLLLSLATQEQLTHVVEAMLDEGKFLSEYGLRSLSKVHENQPFTFSVNGQVHTVSYQPAESTDGMFGGNSNWRGPIWFPVNYLMIESLQKYHHYYGDKLRVAFPSGSGKEKNLDEVAKALSRRLINIFLRDQNNRRAYHGSEDLFQNDLHWRDHILFYEYFHGDNGRGIGASHQTGWTALVAKLIQQSGGLEGDQ
jgi:hypothetical protein